MYKLTVEHILNKAFFFLFFLPFVLLSQNKDVKAWSSINKIQLNDFKGQLIKNPEMSAMSVLALKIVYIKNTKKINVLPFFNRERSYMTNGTGIKSLLKHEQLHFDIFELYARKIRSKLIKYYRKAYDIDLNISYKIYNECLIELNKYDTKYDIETNHSTIIEKQIEWNNKVKKELEEYRDYTSEKYLEYIDDLY